MGRDIPVDPGWLSNFDGDLAAKLLHEDTYFAPNPQDSALSVVLDRLVSELSEDERICLELRVFAGRSYGEIAEYLGYYHNRDPEYLNRKKAWRVTQRALRKLRKEILSREWLASLLPRPEILKEE